MLDDKRPDVRAQLADAPLVIDYLCGACKAHHDRVRELLADLSIPWVDDPRLVRGLDYYTRTTYEFDHPLLGAQSGIGGGGRYDGLSEDIGGPPLPGIGFGLGLDRTVLAMEEEDVAAASGGGVAVYGVPLGEEAQRRVFGLVAALRRAGIAADMAYDGKKLKGAMRGADRSGAAYAVILGERDIAEGTAQVKDLASGEQEAVPLDRIAGPAQGAAGLSPVALPRRGKKGFRRNDPHTRGGLAATRARRGAGRARRLGRAPSRPRWRDVHRPARRVRHRAGRLPRRGGPRAGADLRSEFCVKVTGDVRERPAGNENPEIPTGDIEVVAGEIEVLSESAPLPFPIEADVNVNEEVRLKYRYLDIRREARPRACASGPRRPTSCTTSCASTGSSTSRPRR